jgi:hypothetical protein
MLQSIAITPGTGKTHLAIGLGIRACQAGHRVLFATASQWVDRLAEAHTSGWLQAELIAASALALHHRCHRLPVGDPPFDLRRRFRRSCEASRANSQFKTP